MCWSVCLTCLSVTSFSGPGAAMGKDRSRGWHQTRSFLALVAPPNPLAHPGPFPGHEWLTFKGNRTVLQYWRIPGGWGLCIRVISYLPSSGPHSISGPLGASSPTGSLVFPGTGERGRGEVPPRSASPSRKSLACLLSPLHRLVEPLKLTNVPFTHQLFPGCSSRWQSQSAQGRCEKTWSGTWERSGEASVPFGCTGWD